MSCMTPIAVFYDGHCGLCLRSIRVLRALDWLRRLRFVDFHEEALRQQIAPDIPYDDLDRALHIRYADGRTLTGFAAFRALCWSLPPLWLLGPFFYLPGATFIGDRVYAGIAERRRRCTHERCRSWKDHSEKDFTL